MKEISKEIDSVFQIISVIPVSGDFVDVMAAARNKLRKIQTELKDGLDETE